MICEQCRTPNFSDYRFCRECGGGLDPARSGGGDPDLEALIQDAFARMHTGDYGRALGSIQAALARNPESPAAHGALGLLYEQQGELSEAIHQFRVVVQLCPESTADREKLDTLLAQAQRTEPAAPWLSPRRLAVACAIAAGVITFGVGLGVATQSAAKAHGPVPGPLAGAQGPQGGVLPAPPAISSNAPMQVGRPWNTLAPPSGTPLTPVGLFSGGGRRTPPLPRGEGMAIPDSLRAARGLAPAGIGAVEPLSRPLAPPAPAPRVETGRPPRETVEPIETETGFIRIEPEEKPVEKTIPVVSVPAPTPGAAPPKNPTITITIGPSR